MSSIIVVEGIHDEMRIKEIYPSAHVITTNGSEISKETLYMLANLSKQHEIIIFTDPDVPGERIRKQIISVVPTAKHAFLRKEYAISKNKRKVGIEHATKENIIESLKHVYVNECLKQTICMQDIYDLGLNGNIDSRQLRDQIALYLNIGKPNAKTFLKRLNMLQITKKELEKLCQELKK